MTDMLSGVLRLREAGLSTIPIKTDGSKSPALASWALYQRRLPEIDELREWFGNGSRPGVALICGKVSGSLEVIDFDEPTLIAEWGELVEDAAPGLLARLVQIETPKGGLHALYRSAAIGGNAKLARSADGKKTLIETRGEGGYVVTVGSPAACHPSGKLYRLLNGDLKAIPEITPAEREILFDCARSFNERIKPDPEPARITGAAGLRPGDDYNTRGDSRADLERHGWRYLRPGRRGELWARPGVSHTSATRFDNGSLYVFSTNAEPFETEREYKPFSIRALLDFGGDFKAAAKAIAAEGYGDKRQTAARESVHSVNSVQPTEDAKTEEWEPPTPFGEYDLPAFPLDALPDWLRSFVQGLAVETQTPADLAATLTLANCSACLAGRVVVRVREGWMEPVNSYWLNVLGVGNRKTAVHDAAKAPLEEVEARLIRDAQPEIESARIERSTLEHCLEELKKKAAKAKSKDERDRLIADAKELAAELAEIRVPPAPRLIVSGDITPEALASTLAEQGGRLFLSSDEGELFEIAAGRYGNGPNIEILLKAHTGGKVRVTRRGRAEVIESATLTIGMTVQPDVLCGLASKPTFRGRGLCARFLYTIPKSLVGGRNSKPAPLSDEARSEYAKRLKALAGLEKVTSADGDLAPRVVRLTRDAVDYLTAFMDRLEPQLGERGALYSVADWASKLAGAVARIAAILHFADNAYQPGSITEIPAGAVQRAIKIGLYLIPHALAAYAEMGADPQIENAKYLLRWIQREQLEAFTKRDAFNSNRGRFRKVVEIEPALELLEIHGFIRTVVRAAEPGRKGRKASQLFQVNPATLAEKSHFDPYTQNTQNTQNWGERGNSAYSAYSAQGVENLNFSDATPEPNGQTTANREVFTI